MKLKENSIVKLISRESLLHVVKNVQILSLGYVKQSLSTASIWIVNYKVKNLVKNS